MVIGTKRRFKPLYQQIDRPHLRTLDLVSDVAGLWTFSNHYVCQFGSLGSYGETFPEDPTSLNAEDHIVREWDKSRAYRANTF